MARPYDPVALVHRHAPTVPSALLAQLLVAAGSDEDIRTWLIRRHDVARELLPPAVHADQVFGCSRSGGVHVTPGPHHRRGCGAAGG